MSCSWNCSWSKDQVKMFVAKVKKEAGPAWSAFLTPRLRRALIAEFAFCIVRSSHRVAVEPKDMDSLLIEMEKMAGLEEI